MTYYDFFNQSDIWAEGLDTIPNNNYLLSIFVIIAVAIITVSLMAIFLSKLETLETQGKGKEE